MENRETFNAEQIQIINTAVEMAEEVVSNYYKMSANQWLRPKYDIKTLVDLSPDEIVEGPFAQIIRYKGQRKDASLGSSTYDFYKICIQDHGILAAMAQSPEIRLFPFLLYIVSHELIHIVRFSRFLQHFDASSENKMKEETHVHGLTHDILSTIHVPDLEQVMEFYNNWRKPFDDLKNP
jgi:hypothetical protein